MAFLDTLKQFGLWPQQQGPSQQDNPYGLDEGMMRQARMQSLSNLGSQIMAASVRQTPAQRADLMAGFDMSGGYQDNLMNAAQMKILSAKMRSAQREEDDAEKMRVSLANRLKSLPPGQLRDAAMWFYESGDYNKAGELLFKREQVWDPMTGGMVTVDAFGAPVGGYSSGGGGGSPVPASGGAPAPANPSSVPAAASGGTPAMPQPVEASDPLTDRWRQLLADPSLTPQEVRLIVSQGSDKGAREKHAEIVKNRQDVADKKRIATKDQSEMANTVIDDRRTQMETPQRIVDFAQSIEDTLASGNPTGMRALATQVLFSKVLDPGSAFMTGEADLQQTAATTQQRLANWWQNQGGKEGSPVPGDLVLEMREISRLLGKRALTKLDRIDTEAKTRAGSFGLTDDMLGGKFPLRWNRFADPGLDETGTSRREPRDAVMDDLDRYGG
jgi:hypothetical protein